MNKAEFQRWPALLLPKHVLEVGYGRATLAKFVDCGVLKRIRPAGCDYSRYQKKQIAALLNWEDVTRADELRFAAEPPLLRPSIVREWTGWSETTLLQIADAGGLKVQRLVNGERRFLKQQIAELLGFAGG